MNKDRDRLSSDILSALSRVYEEDRELLSDNIDVCERSLMNRFTHYFMDCVECSKDGFYKGLHVDGEYNRHIHNPKLLEGKLIFPDVIVHKRGTDDRNLCVIEFKKSLKDGDNPKNVDENKRNKRLCNDIAKLKELTRSKGEYRYEWGVHIIFHASSGGFVGVEMKWFYNGEACTTKYQKRSLPQTNGENGQVDTEPGGDRV